MYSPSIISVKPKAYRNLNNTAMPRKKTTYEKKGLVRQITVSLFAPGQKDKTEDSQWRPGKSLFEKLDGADDEEDLELDVFVNSAFSVQRDTTDFSLGNNLEGKKATSERSRSTRNIHKHKKRDPTAIVLKPSCRDLINSRTISTRTKEAKIENNAFANDSFSPDPFDNVFDQSVAGAWGDISVDGTSSKYTVSTKNSSLHTVQSIPTDFFSQQPLKLTKKNLDSVACAPAEANTAEANTSFGIENVNPRSEFLQFTIEEDKDSTVIESVQFPGEDGEVSLSKQEGPLMLEDFFSVGFSNKDALVQTDDVKATANPKKETRTLSHDVCFDAFDEIGEKRLIDDPFFPELGLCEQMESDRDSDVFSAQPFQSTHSLAYSASSCGEPTHLQKSENMYKFINKMVDNRHQHRSPLSPLNVFHNLKSFNTGLNKVGCKPDPDASWADFSDAVFERKPDPNGSNANTLMLSQDSFTAHAFLEQNENAQQKQSQSRKVESLSSKTSKPLRVQRVIPEDEPVNANDDHMSGDYINHYGYGLNMRRASGEEIDRPIGIQRYPTGAPVSSRRSHGSSSSVRSTPYSNTNGLDESDSYNAHSYYRSTSGSTRRESHSESSSFKKPLGIPNNAIMASMLFRRHHDIDAQLVEAKLREREQAHKTERHRGDIPQTVQALDGVSCVSSFSEDTAAKLDMWMKPTQDLLEHFSRSRRTGTDFKSRLREQRAQATELFEA